MTSPAQAVPGYYVWEPPGTRVVVHLSLDVVDALSQEVMRGFGAVRKRGAEVGGLLLGSVESVAEGGSPAVVRIDGFEPVPCEYRMGPSYQFSEEDGVFFDEAFRRVRAVGYYRSHTREGLALAPEDIELLDYFFAGPESVALLVKPYATTASVAGIFVREDGVFPDTTPLEFPFRRNELLGEEPPARRSLMERRLRPAPPMESTTLPAWHPSQPAEIAPEIEEPAPAAMAVLSWSPVVWLTLVCFLVLGGSLGYQAGRTVRAAAAVGTYSLALSVSKGGDNLNVTWDGQSPLALAAQKAVLEIEDGAGRKSVDLDGAQLRNGRLIYRNNSKRVRFRLTLSPDAHVTFTQSTEWAE